MSNKIHPTFQLITLFQRKDSAYLFILEAHYWPKDGLAISCEGQISFKTSFNSILLSWFSVPLFRCCRKNWWSSDMQKLRLGFNFWKIYNISLVSMIPYWLGKYFCNQLRNSYQKKSSKINMSHFAYACKTERQNGISRLISKLLHTLDSSLRDHLFVLQNEVFWTT